MTEKEMDLQTYVEGRFDRLITGIDSQLAVLGREIRQIIESNDLRYQQRFEAQGKELDKAFSAAKEAVNAALVANDKAAAKTEVSADKRFADLGDLIKEQFKGISEKYDSAVRRIDDVENRLNTHLGEASGGDKGKENVRGLWAILIAIGAVLLSLWKTFKG